MVSLHVRSTWSPLIWPTYRSPLPRSGTPRPAASPALLNRVLSFGTATRNLSGAGLERASVRGETQAKGWAGSFVIEASRFSVKYPITLLIPVSKGVEGKLGTTLFPEVIWSL